MNDLDWFKRDPVFTQKRIGDAADKKIDRLSDEISASIDLKDHFSATAIKCQFHVLAVFQYILAYLKGLRDEIFRRVLRNWWIG